MQKFCSVVARCGYRLWSPWQQLDEPYHHQATGGFRLCSIRHQLIYAAALPAPAEDAKALGEKRFKAFLDSVAQMIAKGADNDNEPPEAGKADEA